MTTDPAQVTATPEASSSRPVSGTASSATSPLRRIGETCPWLIVIAVVVYGTVRLASTLRLIVLPTFLALVLACLLAPTVRWLRRHRWPPAAAALAVVLAFLAILGGLGA